MLARCGAEYSLGFLSQKRNSRFPSPEQSGPGSANILIYILLIANDLGLCKLAWHDRCVRVRTLTKQTLMNNHQESTYALLVRSEERSRGALETVVSSTISLTLVVALWNFAHPPENIPASGIEHVARSSEASGILRS